MTQRIEKTSISMKDYEEKILKKTIDRFAQSQSDELIRRHGILKDMEFYGYEPPTRWQRFKCRIENVKQRSKDVWTIVTGGDVHEDCGR